MLVLTSVKLKTAFHQVFSKVSNLQKPEKAVAFLKSTSKMLLFLFLIESKSMQFLLFLISKQRKYF